MDRLIVRNQIKEENFDEEAEDLPFFLDFGDSTLNKMKEQQEGKFASDKNIKSKIIKKRDANEFLDEEVDTLQSLLAQIPIKRTITPEVSQIYQNIFDILKNKNSFEIDHFIKRETMFDAENCLRLLNFFHFILTSDQTHFDLKNLLFKIFIESSCEKFLNIKSNGEYEIKEIRKSLNEIRTVFKGCQDQYEDDFLELTTILEIVSNHSTSKPLSF